MESLNPYESPAAEPPVPTTTAAPSSKLEQYCRALLRPAGLLSFFATCHFFCSVVTWLVLGREIYLERPTTRVAWLLFWGSLPAVLLFAASLVNLIRSIRSQRFALTAAITIYLISGVLFWYDIAHERSQMRHIHANTWVLPPDVSKNTYFTWWWFEDKWLR